MKTSATSQPEYLEGVIVSGGWAHDELDNPCATVQIVVNSHHLMLTEYTVHGWKLEKLYAAPDPEAAFHQAFGAVFGDTPEFDDDTLRDFRRTLEHVCINRIAEVYGATAIPLKIFQFSPDKG